MGSIRGSRKPPGVRNGNLLQYSCLENSTEEPVSYSPCDCKESDTIEWLGSTATIVKDFSGTRDLVMPKQYIPSHISYSASQVALVVKNLPANAGGIRDVGLIPGLGRSPKWGHGNSILLARILEYPMDKGVWWATAHGVAKSQTQWSDLACMHAFHMLIIGLWTE